MSDEGRRPLERCGSSDQVTCSVESVQRRNGRGESSVSHEEL